MGQRLNDMDRLRIAEPLTLMAYTQNMPTRAIVLCLLIYLVVISAVVAGLVLARRRVLATLDTPEARREWQAWKAKTAEQQDSAEPVRRRPVKTDEPPALTLLRDRFAAIVATTVLICSFLFAFLAFVIRGAFRRGGTTP
jgi:hypothetical protein